MAIKPTIYKFRINLSDLNRDIYEAYNLTVALHPSETAERMMARVLAYCLEAREDLAFCKGLSDVEEADLWVPVHDGKTPLWIEVGEPTAERVKKAGRLADEVAIYCFNSKADTWWSINGAKMQREAKSLRVVQFDWSEVEALSAQLDRTMDLSVTLTGQSAYLAGDNMQAEISWQTLL